MSSKSLSLALATIGSNENYDNCNIEYFITSGDKITFHENNREISSDKVSIIHGWNTCYGKKKIKPRKGLKYFWAFVIKQLYGGIAIGMEEYTAKHCESYFQGQEKTVNYAYKSNGKRYSNKICKGIMFSEVYDENDIVLMLLDGYKLSFCKLSKKFCEKNPNIKSTEDYIHHGRWVVAEKKINQTKTYKLAISLYGKTRVFGNDECNVSTVRMEKFTVIEDLNYDQYDDDESDYSDSDSDNYNIRYFNGEQKNGELDEIIPNSAKEQINYLENELDFFMRNKFNKNSLKNSFDTEPSSILIGNDLRNLQNKLLALNKHIESMQCYITSLSSLMPQPDIKQYKNWKIKQMIQWISCLENGAFSSYLNVLKKGFESDHIRSGDLLCELTEENLRNKPFNILDFKMRKKLIKHFQSLKNNDNADNNNNNHKNPYYQ